MRVLIALAKPVEVTNHGRKFMGCARFLAIVAVLMAPLSLKASTRSQPVSEDDLKAVFIFRFTQFVGWPPSAFESPAAPLTIGVIGDDRLCKALEQVAAGESTGGHPLEVRLIRRAADAARCQVLYLAPGEEDARLISRLRARPILTVGDTDAFIRDGGMIRFMQEAHRLRLLINLHAAREASLGISAQLLRVAEVEQ
ncbi:MAG: YfiR family protein [Opitutaceae bacterium]